MGPKKVPLTQETESEKEKLLGRLHVGSSSPALESSCWMLKSLNRAEDAGNLLL